jgi:ribonucleoside-diphosphate reductase alpha chain
MTEPRLSDNARLIFEKRYSRKDADGNPTETPARAIRRVADNVASVNALYDDSSPSSDDISVEEFPYKTVLRHYGWSGMSYESFEYHVGLGWGKAKRQADRYAALLTNLDFVPNSPTWTGAGTELGQLAACFVLPIEDDLGGNPNGIFDTMREAVLIQQTGGGNGFSFGRIRPNGALVKASMGRASGPVGFMKAYDAAFSVIAQGGTRRGANMGVLPVHHPDVEEFITAKVVEGEISNFNISVGVTDAFMEAVRADADFDLHHDGKVYRTVKARELWDMLVRNAWVIGDPGCLFVDAANRENPLPLRYELESTNPCGEQWLGPHENCCLGSINLMNFAVWEEAGQPAHFDWERFAQVVALATEFLDDVVSANQYVSAVPKLEEAGESARRIGLGAMGLSDAMAILGIRYGSPEGQEFAAQVTEFMRYHAMLASIKRASERGHFAWIGHSIYNPDMLAAEGEGAAIEELDIHGKPVTYNLWKRPAPLLPYSHNFGRPKLDWDDVFSGIITHGIRNAAQLTYAPTGTISNFAGLQGSGCEPFFALVYQRTVMQEGENLRLDYLNPIFEEALVRYGFTDVERDKIMEDVIANSGSCQNVKVLPKELRDAFVVAADVTPEEHVRMQAAIQAFVDNSISKTINLPNEATVKDVADVYRLAFDLGCKGITVYRQGSRQLEVLSTKKSDDGKVDEASILVSESSWPTIKPMSLPAYAEGEGMPSRTWKVQTPHGAMWVTVTELVDHVGRPFDVRLTFGKAGNDKNADIEAIGRTVSLALRAGVPVGTVVEQLENIGGSSAVGFGPARVKSAADGLAAMLRRTYLEGQGRVTIKDGEVDASRICPSCHNATLIYEQGCFHCEVRLGGCGNYIGCD